MYCDYQGWYDPSIGRFISQDPLTGDEYSPQSLNPYLYVLNVPTRLVDPTGAAYDEYGDDRDMGLVSPPEGAGAPVITADFWQNIEKDLGETTAPQSLAIAPLTTLDQNTTESSLWMR